MNPTTAEIVAYLREWAYRENRAAEIHFADGHTEVAVSELDYARGLTEAANEIEARW